MNEYEKALHYSCINQFSKEYKKDVLDIEHLISDGKIHVPKVTYTDGASNDEENFFGWKFKKNEVVYLVPHTNSKGEKIELKEILPIIPTKTIEVGYQSKAYTMVKKYSTVKFKSEKVYNLRKIVDILSSIEHTNPDHKKLSTMMALSSLLDRANYRYCTPPGFGKDSVVDILGNLIGGCGTLENPTVAKLEHEAANKSWLAINEIVDIKSEQWQDIEQFLLASGAFKPTINKRSRASSGVGEEIDISDFSISIMYNDITDYPKRKQKKYFDLVAKSAIIDRFPAFRFHGRIIAKFEEMKDTEIPTIVRGNWEFYKGLVYSLTYYKNNLNAEWHGYDTGKLLSIPYRWKANINKLLKIVDVYSNSQEEFNGWISVINDSIIDYRSMLNYNSFLESLSQSLSPKEYIDFTEKLKKKETFTDCIREIDKKLKSEENEGLNNYW